MFASILSTGNEVLIGDITDTNSSYLARRLTELGISVRAINTVGDDVDDICDAVRKISLSSEICVVTGGLGPTQDDMTAKACAKAAGKKLLMDQTAYKEMKAFFKKRGFELTKENEKQALLPESATPLTNEYGTAPGFWVRINQCTFYFMPGVPSEMKQMFEHQVVPLLEKKHSPAGDIRIERLTIFGLGESKVGALLNGFDQIFPQLSLGFRANFPMIEVKIMTKGSARQKTDNDLAEAKDWAVEQLGSKIISTNGLNLAEETGRLLAKHKKTVAVAESCTGGLIANWLTDVSGSSDYFLFSGVTYSNEAKMDVLGVTKQTIIHHGAVHEQTALEMALGAKLKAGADYAVSTTGIAGPTGGTKEKPVGMVCIAVAGPLSAKAKTFVFKREDRLLNKKMFAATALNGLRKQILSDFQTF